MRNTLISSVFVVALVTLTDAGYAAQSICIDTGNGEIKAKPKCKSYESKLSLNKLGELGLKSSAIPGPPGAQGLQGPQGQQGPQGPQGRQGNSGAIDITRCHTFMNSQATTSGAAYSGVTCGANEFLLNYGYYTDPEVSLEFVRTAKVNYLNNIPNGVEVGVQTEFETLKGAFTTFTFYVTGTCCPST